MTESVHKDVSPSKGLQNLIIDKKAWKWESLLLHLVLIAPLMPAAWQAISVGLVGICFLVKRAWKSNVWSSEVGSLYIRTFKWIALSWLLLFILGSLNYWSSGDAKDLTQYVRLIGKQGIWGAIGIAGIVYLQFLREHRFYRSGFLLGVLAFLFSYGLVQRYTGIDWVHGLTAKLPEHRFAYGVYRVSGFMDHPLTLAFNLILLQCFAISELLASIKLRDHFETKVWGGIITLIFGLLLLTDSRFPILLSLIISFTIFIWQIPKIRILAVAAALITLLSAGSFLALGDVQKLGRWGEFFDSKQPLEQRFDRVIFWKINWQLFQSSPLTGTGLKAYEPRLLDTYERAGYTNLERKYNAHNVYLQTLADSGLIGGAALLLVILALGRLGLQSWRRYQFLALPLICIATICIGGLQNNLRDSEFLYGLWITIGLCLARFIVQGKPDGRGIEPKLEDLKS